eukprot:TRINITY_DN2209_c0_g1_i1.p1 TRINITY_DN2209_c0_g1~~TRINITY_DN2209_c0_g1_i1.p1  ORF type:complete len:292 (-),score=25.90 TRINITY_DN2209_c0_g1_i1:37-912(-)
MAVHRVVFVVGIIALLMASSVAAYTPVVIMHGILDNYSTMQPLITNIQTAHPGTQVVSLNINNDVDSVVHMWDQVQNAIAAIQSLPASFANGYHCIGFSQGTLVMRGVIQSWRFHQCKTFITLSGPLMGQFGDTAVLNQYFPSYTRDAFYLLFYTNEMQNHFSVANYWKDPYHINLYDTYSIYLAAINNEKQTANSTAYRNNFLKLDRMVNVGGPDDGVITPWQSAQWSFYDSNLNVVPMVKQSVYIDDSFGLRTLSAQGRLYSCTVSGILHHFWYRDLGVFNKCVAPYLD